MTGRHRGQPKEWVAEDEVDARPSRGVRIGVVAGAFVVPVVVASLIAFGLREEPVRERPESVGSTGRTAGPAVTPEGEPTYGEYVAPEPGPQAGTKPPKRTPVQKAVPRKRWAPRPSPSIRTRRPCPPGWEDVWWMHRWCWPQDGHRGR
ncbi:hypothetical protein E1264_15230 [Actinomadura sp. KC216]|uniref:hypothetical protein n=1 Tax=Actinomadura sp. KC216 TaxID=2530370 RepID=UPI00104B532C|nr:hypothetical protein [Actinomadura sp. KC216]TDB87277.1 hypothetical protein E1264_15230 [Actinomadura sp. KC216]